jgi:hypothetical protein
MILGDRRRKPLAAVALAKYAEDMNGRPVVITDRLLLGTPSRVVKPKECNNYTSLSPQASYTVAGRKGA